MMKECEKRRYDALALIWAAAWDRVKSRRADEWRVTFGVWGGLAAFVVALMKGDWFGNTLSPEWQIVLLVAYTSIGVAILAGHHDFLVAAGKRHNDDRHLADLVLQDMARTLGESALDDVVEFARRARPTQKVDLDWSRQVQFDLSKLLYLGGFIVLLASMAR